MCDHSGFGDVNKPSTFGNMCHYGEKCTKPHRFQVRAWNRWTDVCRYLERQGMSRVDMEKEHAYIIARDEWVMETNRLKSDRAI